MKKTKSAVKYGIETLKLTPDELFKLIESSQGYEGSDYNRWLASKIIEVAEKDGVQFSQLLVKKFNIINEILEEVSGNQDISEDVLDIFKSVLNKEVFSVDFEGIGNPIDVDWYNGIDLDEENSFFVKEKLPTEIKEKILDNEKFSLLFRLSLDNADKKSDLYADAKGQGITLTSKGAMVLYRLCSLASVFDISNAKIGLFVPVKFLYDSENEVILEHLLSYYKVSVGFSLKSIELSTNSLNAGDIAFIVLEVRKDDESEQDGIVLTSITLDEDSLLGYEELATKRYSRSYNPMLNKIADESPMETDRALGYLNINGSMSLSSVPSDGKKCIPITNENILDMIAYHGVSSSREIEWGYSDDIPCLIDGRVGYEELLYNCLPLFLFDSSSKFKDSVVDGVNIPNRLAIDSEVVKGLLDVGAPYFSFEAKELFNLCKDFISFTKENMDISGKTFQELRSLSDNESLNRLYEDKLLSLKDYINKLSKGYM